MKDALWLHHENREADAHECARGDKLFDEKAYDFANVGLVVSIG